MREIISPSTASLLDSRSLTRVSLLTISVKPTGKPFELRTTIPPVALSDDSLTVDAAGLKGASILQKLS